MSEVLRPGYKLTEVGVIPEDWDVLAMNKLFQLKQGVQCSIDGQSSVDGEGRKRFIRIVDLTNPKEEQRFIADPGSAHHVAKADLFMVRYGSPGLVGFGYTGVVANNLFRLIPKRHIEGHFYYQYLANRQDEIAGLSGSSTMPAVSFSTLNHVYVVNPHLHEQRAIATALSDVDALLVKLDTLIAKKRNIKQATMQQLLTGLTRLPGFSGEWEVKSFGEIFDYLPTATNARSDLSDAGDTYYVHYGDIHTRFHSHLDFRNQLPSMIWIKRCRNAALLKNGDWVMADASEDYDGVGKSIEISGLPEGVKAVAGLHTFLLREKTPTFAAGFKGHLGNLKSLHQQYLKVATGMKVFGVSKKALSNLILQIPSIKEQTAISSILSDMDAELATLETRRDKTLALKQGMMQELLTGRIRLI